ncbi:MAG: hypothetical protein NVS3B21_14630 [Acidimicrobiales bacterium]
MLHYAENLVFVAIALACLRDWRRERERSDRWAAAAFGALGGVGLLSLALPASFNHALGPNTALHWVYKVLVAVVLAFPYLLVRFLDSFERILPWQRLLAHVLVSFTTVGSLILPRIPASNDHRRPAWLVAYLFVVFVEWGWLSGFACVRFLLAGRHQPTVVRRRMQVLSLGSFVLIVSLIPTLSPTKNDTASRAYLAGQIIGLLAGTLFYLGIAPPPIFRMMWRRPEERALRRAEVRLMTGATTQSVATAVLPHLPQLFGGSLAVLLDRSGALIGSHGTSGPDEDAELVALLTQPRLSDRVSIVRPGLLAVPLRNGILAVEAGSYTPFFGREEIDLLNTLAAFVDLALARAELFERERDSRIRLELAHEELEGLVYSLSHDLKSPLISLLGYLDYLKIDCGDGLGTTGEFYVTRMAASAAYMTSLIEDLLSLSRIGRTQTEAEDVDIHTVLDEVVSAVRASTSEVTFDIGDLPTLSVNALRTRELFTNLVDNAVRHGGRPDLCVRVWSSLTTTGDVVVYVADDGAGIPETYREKVFGIFERLGAQDSGGTGIGLAVCRKIVEQSGGTIEIIDSGSGVSDLAGDRAAGVTFSITYPAPVMRAAPHSAPVRSGGSV